ncbi:MAG: hypothetical protein L6R40_003860 [Gallowayella cf. fulva]|nr:MAG: hypothetical protein L6R40_003860 [Xanthomendoza cf. fulva]
MLMKVAAIEMLLEADVLIVDKVVLDELDADNTSTTALVLEVLVLERLVDGELSNLTRAGDGWEGIVKENDRKRTHSGVMLDGAAELAMGELSTEVEEEESAGNGLIEDAEVTGALVMIGLMEVTNDVELVDSGREVMVDSGSEEVVDSGSEEVVDSGRGLRVGNVESAVVVAGLEVALGDSGAGVSAGTSTG